MSTGAELPAPSLDLLRAIGRGLLRVPRPGALAAALLWAGAIWFVSSLSPRAVAEIPGWRPFLGNLGHSLEFGILALCLALALPRTSGWPELGRREVAAVLLAVLAYAAVDELHQATTPGRDASVLDALTDVVGAACTLWIATYVGRDGATDRGLAARLGLCVSACLAAASVATLVPGLAPEQVWL